MSSTRSFLYRSIFTLSISSLPNSLIFSRSSCARGNTQLGKKYDLIIEDGELISQQYKTDIGSIDILVRDRFTKNYVVIELKKAQTSDDTIGQLTRYMGWVMDKLGDKKVGGIIIAQITIRSWNMR